MAGDFDRLLSRNELRRFDEALKGQSDPASPGETQTAVSGAARRPTEYEERTWLAQQQDPDAVMRHVVALRLSGTLDIDRLLGAVRALVRTIPDLNARYHFGDEGELSKIWADDAARCLETARAASSREAIDLILAKQAAPWDPESEPPFTALLTICERENVLALLPHRILDETCSIDDLLRGLSSAYAGAAGAPPAARRIVASGTRAAPVAWIRRAETATPLEVSSVSASSDLASWAAGRSAARFGVTVQPGAIAGLTENPPAVNEVVAAVAVQFARFVRQVGGHEAVRLVLPRAPGASLGDPTLPVATTEALQLRVTGAASEAEIRQIVLSRLGESPVQADDPSLDGLPLALVTWLDDPARFFDVKGLMAERLALPTLASLPDLALGVGLDVRQNVRLELVGGQRVSPHASAFLLERFVAFLAGADALEGVPQGTARHASGQASGLVAQSADDGASDDVALVALVLAEFRDALAAPDMGPDEDFFDRGGHSLVATRIIGRLLTNHGLEVHINDLFSHPTAGALAARAVRTRKVESTASAIPDESALTAPLSLAQMSLWKAYAAFGFGEIFNIPFALAFVDRVDESLFQRAFLDVVERHPGLRTHFFVEGSDVRQRVVPVSELSGYKWFWTTDESAGVDRHAEAGHRFDLANELPIRLRFLKEPDSDRQILSFLFHHIVLDEWSVNLLMDELGAAYRARAAGEVPTWSAKPTPFHEFARRQSERGVDDQHLRYWTDMLRGSEKALPILGDALPTTPEQGEASAAGGWVEFKLEPAQAEGLYATARENSASLFNVVYAAIATSMQTPDALSDLVIGTSASGRTDSAFFDTVGYFTTLVAHRVRFSPGLTVGQLIAGVKGTVNESMVHSDIPLDLVEEALGMTPGRDHLFELFIQIHAKNKLNGVLPTPDGKGIEFRQVDPDKHESLLGLQFEVMEETIRGERQIRVLMSYRSDRCGPSEVELLRTRTKRILAQFARAGASSLPLTTVWSEV